jgi:ABC-type siderophore export system fused ATPase/permease subunit
MDIVYFLSFCLSVLMFVVAFIIIQIRFMVGPVSFQRGFVHFVRVDTETKLFTKVFHAVYSVP